MHRKARSMSNTIYVVSMPSVEVTETPDMAVRRIASVLNEYPDCEIPDSERLPKRLVRERCRLVLGDYSIAPSVADGECVWASVFMPARGSARRLFARHSKAMRERPFAKLYATDDPHTYLEPAGDMAASLKRFIDFYHGDDDCIIKETVTATDGSRRVRLTSRLTNP